MNPVRAMVGLLTLVVVLAGCNTGPTLHPVAGTVTYNDKPVEGASVVLIPTEGPLVIGTPTDAAGKFTVMTDGKPGAPAGTYKVTVNKQSAAAGIPTNPTPEDMAKMGEAGKTALAPPELPVKYSVQQSTDLSVTIKPGENNIPLDLK